MKTIFFPGCRIKAGYPKSSDKLAVYVRSKFGIEPVGCCKEDYSSLNGDAYALLICNNCANDLESLTNNINHEFLWKVIDEDEQFPFPDYSGMQVLIQDCDHGYHDQTISEHVRSLLTKMHITYVEMEKEDGIPYGLSREEHRQKVCENASKYETETVVTYCAICNLAMNKAGKNSIYLLDLLFNEKD